MTQPLANFTPPVGYLTPDRPSIDPRVYAQWPRRWWGICPWFKAFMDETQILLRQIFQTETANNDAAFGFRIGRDWKLRC